MQWGGDVMLENMFLLTLELTGEGYRGICRVLCECSVGAADLHTGVQVIHIGRVNVYAELAVVVDSVFGAEDRY